MGNRLRTLVAVLIAAALGLLLAPQATAVPVSGAPALSYSYDGHHHSSPPTYATTQRGPPAASDGPTTYNAVDRWSQGISALLDSATPSDDTTYDDPMPLVHLAGVAPRTQGATQVADGYSVAFARTSVAAKTGSELRRVGDVLESIDDVYANPQLLAGRPPAIVENILKDTPGWQVEKLGQGSQAGRGWVFRQYTESGTQLGSCRGGIRRWSP